MSTRQVVKTVQKEKTRGHLLQVIPSSKTELILSLRRMANTSTKDYGCSALQLGASQRFSGATVKCCSECNLPRLRLRTRWWLIFSRILGTVAHIHCDNR